MQRAIEAALRLAAVPYQVVAGLEFYQRREIKDLIAYLRLAVNPNDDVAFLRVVNTPTRGIGDTSLARLGALAGERDLPLAKVLDDDEAIGSIRGRARSGLADFRSLLQRLGDAASVDAAVALDLVLAELDVPRWLSEMDDGSGAQDREANVDELRVYAADFDALAAEREGGGGLRGFLQEIALVSDADGGGGSADQVRLMTLHAAKGLEFPLVVLAGVEEELLPHGRALMDAADPMLAEEEERRLFYVGVTRAERHLVLTHAGYRSMFGSGRLASPSRFLGEIPRELCTGAAHGRSGAETDSHGREDEGEDEVLGTFEDPGAGLTVGDLVQHGHFGRGRIRALVGSGVNARATVEFTGAGTRQLLLQYAKLERLGR
jgi:DNA helicase-2/ATP-dependent DNA helicase PcrA